MTIHQSNRRRSKKQNYIIQGAVFLIAIAAFLVLHPDLAKAIFDGNSEEIVVALENTSKIKAAAFIAALQVIQVFTIVFPGMPIHIAAGILLGPVLGFFTCYLSFLLGNAMVYLRLIHSGARDRSITIPARISMNKKAAKIIDRLTQEEGGMIRIVMVSILPFFPNGVVPYYAASMKIPGKIFITGVMIGCPVPIITDCLAGHLLLHGHVILAILISVALFLIAAFIGFHEDAILRWIKKIRGRRSDAEMHRNDAAE